MVDWRTWIILVVANAAIVGVVIGAFCDQGRRSWRSTGGDIKNSISVLVHTGGRRLAVAPPELVSVAPLKGEGVVLTGRLLETPEYLPGYVIGDTIKFIRVGGYPHPVLVTDKYLMERRHSYVMPCNKCGFSELFDCPSELLAATFPGQLVSTFTARCPICNGGQLVRLLPTTPSLDRCASDAQLAAAVRAVVAAELDKVGSTIAPDQPLSNQGADELHLVEIVFALEEHFVVLISDEQIGDYSALTLAKLISIVRQVVTERQDDQILFASDTQNEITRDSFTE